MTVDYFQLDTSGKVATLDGFWTTWSDLSPFTQGYIEALLADAVPLYNVATPPRFTSLAPETLARIIADCDLFQSSPAHDHGGDRKAKGAAFWNARVAAPSAFEPKFPPLTVQLGDDCKVRFA